MHYRPLGSHGNYFSQICMPCSDNFNYLSSISNKVDVAFTQYHRAQREDFKISVFRGSWYHTVK